jgi:sulfate adenylyltransferase subunit 1 (EFTu-like GTPase family)
MADQVADAEIDLSRLTDGLRAEREQGITIDVAYRFFATRAIRATWSPEHRRPTRRSS